MSVWRGPLGVTWRQCMRASALPTAAAALLAAVGHAWGAPVLAGDGAAEQGGVLLSREGYRVGAGGGVLHRHAPDQLSLGVVDAEARQGVGDVDARAQRQHPVEKRREGGLVEADAAGGVGQLVLDRRVGRR